MLAIVGAFGLGVGKAGLAGMSLRPRAHLRVSLRRQRLHGDRPADAARRRRRRRVLLSSARAVGLRAANAAARVHRCGLRRGSCAAQRSGLQADDRLDHPRPATMQIVRMYRPHWFGNVPHTRCVRVDDRPPRRRRRRCSRTRAGPIFAIYCLAVGLPKLEFVGTGAWFFLIVNAFKVPFSARARADSPADAALQRRADPGRSSSACSADAGSSARSPTDLRRPPARIRRRRRAPTHCRGVIAVRGSRFAVPSSRFAGVGIAD